MLELPLKKLQRLAGAKQSEGQFSSKKKLEAGGAGLGLTWSFGHIFCLEQGGPCIAASKQFKMSLIC